MPALAVSCFGKLPFHREFIRVGLASPAAAWVVRWVDGAHAAWARGGEAPPESPVVRFAAAIEGALVAGVVRQSSDGLRRHPVTFFVEDTRTTARADWHLAPLALEASWAALAALAARGWTGLGSLTASLEAGVPVPEWEVARNGYRDLLVADATAAPWNVLVGADGDAARHVAANLLAVADAQRDARSAPEGVSVALPLPASPALSAERASLWLEILDLAIGSAAERPAIVLGDAPPRLVAFYRPPEGPDLAAVLSSLEMAPIDDLAEPWQTPAPAGSAAARACDTIVGPSAAGTFADLIGRLRSAARQ